MLETVKPNREDPLFLQYILDFWTVGSPYLKTKELSNGHPHSNEYIDQNYDGIKLHVATFKRFEKLRLSKFNVSCDCFDLVYYIIFFRFTGIFWKIYTDLVWFFTILRETHSTIGFSLSKGVATSVHNPKKC